MKWTQTDIAQKVPKRVLAIVQILQQKGYEAYLVGGCVRDMLQGVPPQDFDIATNALAHDAIQFFPKGHWVGKQFGVIAVDAVQIATFRQECDYTDFRHPDHVTFSTLEKDSMRRDFTINALYYDPITHRVIDLHHGHKDLQHRILRSIGDPYQRLKEDALRLLRGVRFKNQLYFTYDPLLVQALQDCKSLLRHISLERVQQELFKITLLSAAPEAYQDLASMGFLEILFPNKALSSYSIRGLQHLLHQIPNAPLSMRWSRLFGKDSATNARVIKTSKVFQAAVAWWHSLEALQGWRGFSTEPTQKHSRDLLEKDQKIFDLFEQPQEIFEQAVAWITCLEEGSFEHRIKEWKTAQQRYQYQKAHTTAWNGHTLKTHYPELPKQHFKEVLAWCNWLLWTEQAHTPEDVKKILSTWLNP